MLEIKNVSKTFNPGTVNAKTALKGLNLTLNDGDFVTVIGGNGAGKSTRWTRAPLFWTVRTSPGFPNSSGRWTWAVFSRTP